MQTNTVSQTLVGLNRVLVTLQLTPDTKEESDALVKTSTASANDKQKSLVEKPVFDYCNSVGRGFILIGATVNKNGTVDVTLEKTGGMGGI
ncbi:MAG: hypothetical protein KDC07_02090 [Chitinophagaceae bacterium]|nr:hypothetical protein [Chitinophagaceae bacterium]MCB9045400.1 hypothetical protein [Chitinophagales bacterium]